MRLRKWGELYGARGPRWFLTRFVRKRGVTEEFLNIRSACPAKRPLLKLSLSVLMLSAGTQPGPCIGGRALCLRRTGAALTHTVCL